MSAANCSPRVTGLHRKDMYGKIDRRGDVRLSQRLDLYRSLGHPTGRPRRLWMHIVSPGCAATFVSHSAQCRRRHSGEACRGAAADWVKVCAQLQLGRPVRALLNRAGQE
jgi:hypothetical protein